MGWKSSSTSPPCALFVVLLTGKRENDDNSRNEGQKRRHVETMTPRPLNSDGLVWPILDEISETQAKYSSPAESHHGDDSIWRVGEHIWISTNADSLIQRLVIISHCDSAGHRGTYVMEPYLRRLFAMSCLSEAVRAFCRECLLCLHVKGGKIIPRPFSESHHSYDRNATLHWDFF